MAGKHRGTLAASIVCASLCTARRAGRNALKRVWLRYDKCFPFWALIEPD